MPTIMTVTFDTTGQWEPTVNELPTAPNIWYKFNETSGNIINYGSDGATANMTPGAFGGSFNGVYAQPGQVASASALDFNGSGQVQTGAAWGDQTTGTFFFLINMGPSAPTGQWIWSSHLGFDNDGLFFRTFGLNAGFSWQDNSVNGRSKVGTVAISDGQWHSVAIVGKNDAINGPEMYIDGVSDPGQFLAGTDPEPEFWFDDFSPGESQIGARGGVSSTTPRFSGLMDEFLYFDGLQLTPTEIADLHNAAF